MNNDEITKPINLEEETKIEETPNKNFFVDIIKESVPDEAIRQRLESVGGWKNDRVEEVRTPTDEDKLEAYEKLEVKDLPADWKIKFSRLEFLEKKQADYDHKTAELTNWTEAFGEKKPSEVQAEIKELEAKGNQTETELKEKINDLEANLETSKQDVQNVSKNLNQKVKDLEEELNNWTETWKDYELEELKEMWEDLNQRPDIPITETEWWDDYVRRKNSSASEEDEKKIAEEKKKVEELKQENKQLWTAIKKFLERGRVRRYILSSSVSSAREAQNAIAELLEKTEKKWGTYLESGEEENLEIKDLQLGFSWGNEIKSNEKKKERAYQVLVWIKQARETLDYQKLFENWNGNKEYSKFNEENDYDGSLYLLKCYLEKIAEEEKMSPIDI